jgi:hypothetical protein
MQGRSPIGLKALARDNKTYGERAVELDAGFTAFSLQGN